jgi:hypothetical protein
LQPAIILGVQLKQQKSKIIYAKIVDSSVSIIRDISEIENIGIRKVLSVLVKSVHKIRPEQKHYDRLEVDEF